ncbi:hypothetical protein CGLO_06676 [Colletotrichum gloeosporioides Cg-14]|uniref:SCP domain-containing protein n=1 Tax=Colletotrichum gloeosporioides (strain Cg-14) TaxID=1237896 RepID=T0KDT8_COLGC|nr:hypothetical protein CGLO_06676 [Colletotrichum gloeosporioides Cg-14]
MPSPLHLFPIFLLACLTTALLPILDTPDPLIKHIANTNPPAWLSPQACHPRSNFPSAAPVNATDLREDAKRFCARAAELAPVMRPQQVLRGNGLGAYSEQHFQLQFLHPCPHRDTKAQDPEDPMGDGTLVKGESWCVELLAENWNQCKDQKYAGVGGMRVAGCVLYTTGPGHLAQ